ncbi:MAG: antitoxin VapB family protein [Thermofilum sp.]|jgi:predicted CopG family antitoxin|nr:antitoxin VapB family protein [Thermofilum sp.]
MPSKTITISLEAYEALVRLKKPGESFSELILRLVKNSPDISDLEGAWRDVPEEKIVEAFKGIREAWASWRPPMGQ